MFDMKATVTGHQRITESKKKLSIELRKRLTVAERKLWSLIRNRQLGGVKFRRQQIVAGFIVDFYCAENRLAIELDGDVHALQEQYDKDREAALLELGIRTIRFTNHEVLEQIEAVLEKLRILTSP
jgi:very-short-patch-repair endonuclease